MYGHVENKIKNCDIIIHDTLLIDVKVMAFGDVKVMTLW
jgi:hypothetical protein